MIGGVACRKQKGEIKQLPETIRINYYSTKSIGDEESQNSFQALEHHGSEPRMYVYRETSTMGEPVYVKVGDVEDGMGRSLASHFYKNHTTQQWTYVDATQTLTWDFEFFRYNEKTNCIPHT